MLGNTCNFKCNYCFPGSNEGNKPWPKYNIALKNLKHLLSKYNKKTQIYFVGGEPTLWKDFPNFCKEIKKEFDVVISISTNGSRKLSWWEKHWDAFDIVSVSIHHEFCKIPQTKKLLDFLYDKKIECNADVLMDPAHFEKCCNIVNDLQKDSKAWPVIAKAVVFDGSTRYTQDQELYFEPVLKRMPDLDWYYAVRKRIATKITVKTSDSEFDIDNNSWFALHGLNKFKGWTCTLGVNILKIESNGTIHGNCGEFLYGQKFKYNLYDRNFIKDFNPKIIPIMCTKNICPCSGEAGATKWINNA